MILNIRKMKDSDIENVYSIETNVHIAPWSKDILRDCVLVGYDCRVLEINNGDSPILAGYIISRISNNSCHILNLCIAKPLQSKGLGRKLLQTVLYSLSKYTQTESVILEVRPSNSAALHLYETMGFEKIEIKKDYYKDKNSVEDAILLKKMLHH
ncbi:ribosomal protein S18-alanine N-acetyltransferase [Legionella pneumophila]|uniref:[Ribosomal protein bS18]-alanine N-acetyltransferase n=1 Tax=Legionella pneumophila subsp. pascullei TaxID=91890 RepID=A0AAX2IVF7_LEGPN|nr:ribosomal protein S18-alanine N-acetyltransferase [Legionella pneumophila]AMP89846.1 ribosomal-protein-alanine N-acetyltransferase RimI [Legionella pneumophila subsp. pascullei]AMP92488.1 ribosomal-protein-alanine acetyltransferase [Legionella pneumophila subsp. pascullei]AMP95454.1 ribosomal-protein-alanine acetyltransferase [Legionella pneumophila subsp. pascullei]SQG90357.1 N-acetyltransferase GCN5 [Legionella pneumophila subsp. pascullei]VEH06547.1 N-acetyltransferase GCN5 [Legionella p